MANIFLEFFFFVAKNYKRHDLPLKTSKITSFSSFSLTKLCFEKAGGG
jgi:hypothetical protein